MTGQLKRDRGDRVEPADIAGAMFTVGGIPMWLTPTLWRSQLGRFGRCRIARDLRSIL